MLFSRSPRHKSVNDNLNLHGKSNKKYFFSNNFLIFKSLFNELEQFYSSSSSSSENLCFRSLSSSSSSAKQPSFFEYKFAALMTNFRQMRKGNMESGQQISADYL